MEVFFGPILYWTSCPSLWSFAPRFHVSVNTVPFRAIRVARTGATGSILVNLSGRGDKDLDYLVEKYGYGDEFLARI